MTRTIRAAEQFRIVVGVRPARVQFLPDGALGCYDHRGEMLYVEEAAK